MIVCPLPTGFIRMTDLTKLESHFAFGENWASYAAGIGEPEIAQARRDLARLLGSDSLAGRTFLDIGCGSGLHSLAATRMGAQRILACDLDPASVRTTRTLLERFEPSASCEATECSVFSLSPDGLGTFDVVYSWGVLHHTGNLDRALAIAASLVAPGGVFIVALYRKTLLCPFWKLEKRWYSKASQEQQRLAQRLYTSVFRLGLRLTGRDPGAYVASYRSKRGMDFAHDVHDWLGGHPYESMSAARVDKKLRNLGFERRRAFTTSSAMQRLGILGSGCDEYVYERSS